jgi:hypothetical protein
MPGEWMMRFQIFVIIPSTTSDIVGIVEQLMIPYDIERPVLPHRVDIPLDELASLRTQQQMDGIFDDPAFCDKLSNWYGYPCFYDKRGYYYLSSDNPKGYWDGWILHDAQMDVYQLPDASIHTLDPLAIVTPDDVWHEMPYQWNETTQQAAQRRLLVRQFFDQYPDYVAVLLDCHC